MNIGEAQMSCTVSQNTESRIIRTLGEEKRQKQDNGILFLEFGKTRQLLATEDV